METQTQPAKDETITLQARCACGTFYLSLQRPKTSLPLKAHLCTCNSCKHVTGSLGLSSLFLPTSEEVEKQKLALTAYGSNERVTYYFCPTCGAHTLSHGTTSGSHMSTALLDQKDGIFSLTGIIWVGDTLDGGMASWMRTFPGTGSPGSTIQAYESSREDKLFDFDATAAATSSQINVDQASQTLSAVCHCKGVRFTITRPNAASYAVKSPWPDLLHPYHSKTSAANPDNTAWWIRNNTKYLAGVCVCPSCVQNLGCEVQAWAFIPRPNILLREGSVLDLHSDRSSSSALATLQTYHSSPGTYREFCNRCGATIFWHCDERPDLIDVSVGVLQSAKGHRAQDWLDWVGDRVSFRELAVGKALAEELEVGLRMWSGSVRANVEG